MTTVFRPRSRRSVVSAGRERLTITYLDPATNEARTCGLDQAAGAPVERCLPIRRIPSYIGQKHTPGWFYSATTGTLLGFESHLESQWLTLFDHEHDVVGIATQALIIDGVGVGEVWAHTPDIFCRLADGTARLVDVKNPRRLGDDDVQQQADRTRAFCHELGWDYRLVGAVPAQRYTNTAWLRGYRRPLHAGVDLVPRLLALAASPLPIGELLSFIDAPEIALPVVFHLLWHHQLACDLDRPLTLSTLVTTTEETQP
ncbi:TnsA-like heteromeric transposase endonuclease subunit [Streptomyces roseoverticillatus]|uniref:TnsA-like heteromeric transposase endonuclease subunit n=1 Tax=Streptomyces roseoverticillatus TaxID=66429 RepID=A0ABV3IN81_9ACTN